MNRKTSSRARLHQIHVEFVRITPEGLDEIEKAFKLSGLERFSDWLETLYEQAREPDDWRSDGEPTTEKPPPGA